MDSFKGILIDPSQEPRWIFRLPIGLIDRRRVVLLGLGGGNVYRCTELAIKDYGFGVSLAFCSQSACDVTIVARAPGLNETRF